MTSLLPPGRLETTQVYGVHQQQQQQQYKQPRRQQQQQQQQQQQSAGVNGGSRELIMRAANSRRSVAVSDAILAAQSAFAGGEFQPEEFPRAACLLVEAFEGGDNAVRLCTARLLERFRPYLGSNILAVEVVQRVSQLLGHDDPTTRELCLDVLGVLAFAVGGLPRSVLRVVGLSLRSPFLVERQAAARAYASCISVQRSNSDDVLSPTLPPPSGTSAAAGGAEQCYPRTLSAMTALSSALLPVLTWDGAVSTAPDEILWETTTGSGAGAGSRSSVEALLEAVLPKLNEDLPSTELWESLRGFLLHPTTERGDSDAVAASLDLILSRLRTSASAEADGTGSPILRAVAVDFIVAMVRLEAEGRISSLSADASASSSSSATAPDPGGGDARKDGRDEGNNNVRRIGRGDAAKGRGPDASVAGVAKAEETGHRGSTRPDWRDCRPGSAVWCLLDALDTSETDGEKAELVSVLGTPAVADAVLDLEVSESVTKRNAARQERGGSSSSSRKSGNALATKQFPLAMAAVEKLRDCSPSSPGAAGGSAQVHLARAVALVSFATTAFRRAPSSDGGGGDGPRGEALRTLGELAAKAALCSRPVLRVMSGDGDGGGGGGGVGSGLEARIVLHQLRTLAAVHLWPRREVGLAVVRRLGVLSPESSVAVELAVLSSHIVEAGGDWGEEGGLTLEGSLWDLLFGRRFSAGNPKAAVGIAVALMRFHRGSLERQSTLSAALVEAMGASRRTCVAQSTSAISGKIGQGPSSLPAADQQDVAKTVGSGGGGRSGEVSVRQDSLGEDDDFDGSDGPGGGTKMAGGGGGLEAGNDVTEGGPLVLDPWYQLVLCRECMLHGFHQAAEAGLRRMREGGEMATVSDAVWVWTEVLVKVSAAEAYYGGSSDQVAAHACATHETIQAAEVLSSLPRPGGPRHAPRPGGTGDGNVAGICRDERDGFFFQRSFLQARAELLQLLGVSWGVCQDLLAARNSRYARYTRREGRCRRIPAAFRRLARDFRRLRGLRPGAGPTTSEPLRAASCLCLLLAIAADALLNQGKSVLVGSRDKSPAKRRSWRGWLERLAGGEGGGDGPLMKAARVLGARLLGLGSAPQAAVGRAAFTSILESVRGVPFPMPRAFFRTGGEPRLSLSLLPPPPPAAIAPDADNDWEQPQQLPQQQPQRNPEGPSSPPLPSPSFTVHDNNGTGTGTTKKRVRDGGLGARYYGPSCKLRSDAAVAERLLRRPPPLPLMATEEVSNGGGTGTGEVDGSFSFSPSEVWWAQTAKEEAFSGSGGAGVWRLHPPQVGSPGVWLVQGSVYRGRGADSALPVVSEVLLEVSAKLPVAADSSDSESFRLGQGTGMVGAATPKSKRWCTKVSAETFGAAADSATALCFRAQVPVPSLNGARSLDVAVSLRSGVKDKLNSTRLIAVMGRGSRSNAANREREVWSIGSVSVPLASAAPIW